MKGATMDQGEIVTTLADPVEQIACRKCNAVLDVSRQRPFTSIVCPQCGFKQMVPALLGQFLLIELLGVGGMGAVYKALDQTLGRYVAIKVMKRSMGDDPHFVENFLREARAAAAINHRNVVQIYSCGQEKGQPYIVMELVSGGRLDELMAKGEPLDEVRVLEIAIDVAEGLKAAHEIGLIHGDIKPANILFDSHGTAKVADFGLARFVAWQQHRGEIWGTPYYIAPEKARGQKEDHRSDIYSLGATLYHALGAKPPFDGKTATDVVLARLKNPAVSIRVIRPSLQPETAAVIGRMLEADPFLRYPTYASLLTDLREALRVAKQNKGAPRREKKQNWVPWVALLGGILGGITLLIVLLVRALKAPPQPAPLPELPPSVRLVPPSPPGAARPKPPEVVQPAEPPKPVSFTPEAITALTGAAKNLAEGAPDSFRARVQKIRAGYSKDSEAALWLSLMDGIGAVAAGQPEEARTVWSELAAIESAADSGALAKLMAQWLTDKAPESAIQEELARWPEGFGAFWLFVQGTKAIVLGNLDPAANYWDRYVAASPKDPPWASAFQAAARVWVSALQEFERKKSEAQSLMAKERSREAVNLWEGFVREVPPFLRAFAQAELAQARERAQREAEQRRIAEQRAREEQIQRDLDQIDAARAENVPAVLKRDYRKALTALSAITSAIKSPEGQKVLANLRESYERMEDLKKFLIQSISESPFPAGSDLGGRTLGADGRGVRVALGQHGELFRPWEEISVRTYFQMVNHYLSERPLAVDRKADLLVSAAVCCFEAGGFKPALNYAEEAVRLKPELKGKIQILMPNLLP